MKTLQMTSLVLTILTASLWIADYYTKKENDKESKTKETPCGCND